MKILTAALLLAQLLQITPTSLPPGGTFIDDDYSSHEASIEAIAAEHITVGCNPPDNTRFCPEQPVTRGQMASFLVRALDLPPSDKDFFVDDSTSEHEADINALAATNVTLGCNPPENDRYCPKETVTREQMASFLVRGLNLPSTTFDFFDDDRTSQHEADINSLAAAGITKGCSEVDSGLFCGTAPLLRGQMATFLQRGLGLEAVKPPPRSLYVISEFTTYYNCCEDRVVRVHEFADSINGITLAPGEIFSALAIHSPIRSGNCQTSTTLFNAAFFAGLKLVDFKPHTYNYARYPDGIDAEMTNSGSDLKFQNDTDFPIRIEATYTDTSVTVSLWGYNFGRSVTGDFNPAVANEIFLDVEPGQWHARSVEYSVQQTDSRTFRVNRSVSNGSTTTSSTWSWTYR